MKTKTNEWYRKKCVNLVKKQVRETGKCRRCSRTKQQGFQMHGSHIYPEGVYKSMSADIDNILCLCAICHWWWHENPVESGQWFKDKFPELAGELKTRSQETKKVDWKKAWEIFKKLY